MSITETLNEHRKYFQSGKTRDYDFRIDSLVKLKDGVVRNRNKICEALYHDLHKPFFEGFGAEVALVLDEINYHLEHLKDWMKIEHILPDYTNFYAIAEIRPQPLGVVLIMAPWNYPFQLLMSPLIGALSAGNCVVLKPANYSVNTSRLLCDMIHECLDERHVSIFTGNRDINKALLEERYDHIFFTGGIDLGKIVMEKAARNLTPVTLELGGKSPCIVDADANIDMAAKRIAFGKFTNAGQTCIAPDYGFIHRKVVTEFLSRLAHHISKFFSGDPINSDSYGRIINEQQFTRLLGLMKHGKIYSGGRIDKETRFIEPTIITNISASDPIMQEEIFGPLFPIMEFEEIETVIDYINNQERPLAFYYFSEDRQKQDYILEQTISGGGCINDTVMHHDITELPFGGVGFSGMGCYHGKYSFDTFSHYRSILRKSTKIDMSFLYPPYTKNKINQLNKLYDLG